MQTLQLYIQNNKIDLFKDESVSITQTIQNVRDIAKIFTEFTKTFTLPASKKIIKYLNIIIILTSQMALMQETKSLPLLN